MNGIYYQEFIFPFFKAHSHKNKNLEFKILSFLGLVDSQLLLRSLNKSSLTQFQEVAPSFFDDKNKKPRSLKGLQKYEVKYSEQISALRECMISKKKVDLQLSVFLRIIYEDVSEKYRELNSIIQLLNQMPYLHHLILDGSNVDNLAEVCESFDSLKMSKYQNTLKSIQFEQFKFNDEKSSSMLTRIFEVQCSLKVIKFEKCQLHCDSIEVLINYLGSNHGGQSLIEIAFVAIEFDWKVTGGNEGQNQQQELAIALLKQPSLTSLTIKHTKSVRTFIYEILTRSGIQPEQPVEVPDEIIPEFTEEDLQNDDLFDNLINQQDDDITTKEQEVVHIGENIKQAFGLAEEQPAIFIAQPMTQEEVIIKEEEVNDQQKPHTIHKEHVQDLDNQQDEIANDNDDQFEMHDEGRFGRSRSKAMTINKPKKTEKVVQEIKEQEEDWDEEDQFNFNDDGPMMRTRGEAFTIKGEKHRIEDRNIEAIENKVEKEDSLNDYVKEEDFGFDNYELFTRTRGEAITIKKQKINKEEEPLEMIKQEIIKEEMVEIRLKQESESISVEAFRSNQSFNEEEDHEEEFGFMEQRSMTRTRGQAMTFKRPKNQQEDIKNNDIISEIEQQRDESDDELGDAFSFLNEGRSRGEAITIKTIKPKEEPLPIEVKVDASNEITQVDALAQNNKQNKIKEEEEQKTVVDQQQEKKAENAEGSEQQNSLTQIQEKQHKQDEEFEEQSFMPRARGQAMTIIKSKNKEELELIQKAILEQANESYDQDDNFGFLEEQFLSRPRGEVISIKAIEPKEEPQAIEDVISAQEINQEEVLTYNVLQNEIKQEDQKTIVEQLETINDDDQIIKESIQDKNNNGEAFEEQSFMPRSRGQAMTMNKSKNKQELELIQKAIQDQANESQDQEDNFAFLEEQFLSKAKDEAIAIIDVKPDHQTSLQEANIVSSEDNIYDGALKQNDQEEQVQEELKEEKERQEQILNKINEDESFEEQSFIPRSRGQAMTMSKSKNKEELELIQKAIQEQAVESQDIEDNFGFLEEQFMSMNRGEVISTEQIKPKEEPQIIEDTVVELVESLNALTSEQQQQKSEYLQIQQSLVEKISEENKEEKVAFEEQSFLPRSRGQAMTISKSKNKEELEIIQKAIQEQVDESSTLEDNFGFLEEEFLSRSRGEAISIKVVTSNVEQKQEEIIVDIKLESQAIEHKIEPQVIEDKIQSVINEDPLPIVVEAIQYQQTDHKIEELNPTQLITQPIDKVESKEDELSGFSNTSFMNRTRGEALTMNRAIDNKDFDVFGDSYANRKPIETKQEFGFKFNDIALISRPSITKTTNNEEVTPKNNSLTVQEEKQPDSQKVSSTDKSPTKGTQQLVRSRRTMNNIKKPPTKIEKIDDQVQQEHPQMNIEEIQQKEQVIPHKSVSILKAQTQVISKVEENKEDDNGFGFDFDQMTRQRGEAMTISKSKGKQVKFEITPAKDEPLTIINEEQPVNKDIQTEDLNKEKPATDSPNKVRQLERSRRTMNAMKKPATKVLPTKASQNQSSSDIEANQISASSVLEQDQPLKEEIQIIKEDSKVLQQIKEEEVDRFGVNFKEMTRVRGEAMTINRTKTRSDIIGEVNTDKFVLEEEDNMFYLKNDELFSRTRGDAMSIKGSVQPQETVQQNSKDIISLNEAKQSNDEQKLTHGMKELVNKNDVIDTHIITNADAQSVIENQNSQKSNESDKKEFGFDFGELTRASMSIKKVNDNNLVRANDQITEFKPLNTTEQALKEYPPKVNLQRSRRTISTIKKPATKIQPLPTTEIQQDSIVITSESNVSGTSTTQASLHAIKEEVIDNKQVDKDEDGFRFNFEEMTRARGEAMTIKNTKKLEEQPKISQSISNSQIQQSLNDQKVHKGDIKPESFEEKKEININTQFQQDSKPKVDQEVFIKDIKGAEKSDIKDIGFNFDELTRVRGEAMSIKKTKDNQSDAVEANNSVSNIINPTDDSSKAPGESQSKMNLQRSRRTALPIKRAPIKKTDQEQNAQDTSKDDIKLIKEPLVTEQIIKQEPIKDIAKVAEVKDLIQNKPALFGSKSLLQENEDSFGFNFDELTKSRGQAMTISKQKPQVDQNTGTNSNLEQPQEVDRKLIRMQQNSISLDQDKTNKDQNIIDEEKKAQKVEEQKNKPVTLARSRRTAMPIKKPATKAPITTQNTVVGDSKINEQTLLENDSKTIEQSQLNTTPLIIQTIPTKEESKVEPDEEEFNFDSMLKQREDDGLDSEAFKKQEDLSNSAQSIIQKQEITQLNITNDSNTASTNETVSSEQESNSPQKRETLTRSRRTAVMNKKPASKIISPTKIDKPEEDRIGGNITEQNVAPLKEIEVKDTAVKEITATQQSIIDEKLAKKLLMKQKLKELESKDNIEEQEFGFDSILKSRGEMIPTGNEKILTQQQLDINENKIETQSSNMQQQLNTAQQDTKSSSHILESTSNPNAYTIAENKTIQETPVVIETPASNTLMKQQIQEADKEAKTEESKNKQGTLSRSRRTAMTIKKPKIKEDPQSNNNESEQVQIQGEQLMNKEDPVQKEDENQILSNQVKQTIEAEVENSNFGTNIEALKESRDEAIITTQQNITLSSQSIMNETKEVNKEITSIDNIQSKQKMSLKDQMTQPTLEPANNLQNEEDTQGFVMFDPSAMYKNDNPDENEEEDQFSQIEYNQESRLTRPRGEAMTISKSKLKNKDKLVAEQAYEEQTANSKQEQTQQPIEDKAAIKSIINAIPHEIKNIYDKMEIIPSGQNVQLQKERSFEEFNPASLHGNDGNEDEDQEDQFDQIGLSQNSRMTRSRGAAMTMSRQKMNQEIKDIDHSKEDFINETPSKNETSKEQNDARIIQSQDFQSQVEANTHAKIETAQDKQSEDIIAKINDDIQMPNLTIESQNNATKTINEEQMEEKKEEYNSFKDEESEDQFGFNFERMERSRGEAMTISKSKNNKAELDQINSVLEAIKEKEDITLINQTDIITEQKHSPILKQQEVSKQSIEQNIKSQEQIVIDKILQQSQLDNKVAESKEVKEFNPASMYNDENDDDDEDQFAQISFNQEARLTRSRGAAMTMSRQKLNQELSSEGAKQEIKAQEILLNKEQIEPIYEQLQVKDQQDSITKASNQNQTPIERTGNETQASQNIIEQEIVDHNVEKQSFNIDEDEEDQFGSNFDRIERPRGEEMTISKSKNNRAELEEINQAIEAIKEKEQVKIGNAINDVHDLQQNPAPKQKETSEQSLNIKATLHNNDYIGTINNISKQNDIVEKQEEFKGVEEFNPASIYEDDDEEEDQFAQFGFNGESRMTRSRGEAMTYRKTINKGESSHQNEIKQTEAFKEPAIQKEDTQQIDQFDEEEDQFGFQEQFQATRSRGEAMTIRKSMAPGKGRDQLEEEQNNDWGEDDDEDQFSNMNTRTRGQAMTLKRDDIEDEQDKEDDMFGQLKEGTIYRSRGQGLNAKKLDNKDKVKFINDMLNPMNEMIEPQYDNRQQNKVLDNKDKVRLINNMLDPGNEGEKFGQPFGQSRQRGQAMTMKKQQKPLEDEKKSNEFGFIGKQARQRGAAMTMARQKKKETATIKTLSLVQLDLEDSDIIHFKEGFEKIQGLESLELYGNQISNEGIKVIGQAFKNENLKSLKYLGLRNNQIDDTGFYEFLYNVAESPYQRLEHLSACSNQIQMEYNCHSLAQILKAGSLKQLDLVGSPSLQLEGLLSLDDVFQTSNYPSNEAFNLLFNEQITFQEVQTITKFMKKDKNLSKVILYDYLMDDDAAVLFFSQVFQTEAITLNLMNLSIFHNNLEDTDIELLTQKLDTSFPALKILDLRGNEITDEGAMLIAESLAQSYSQSDRRKWMGLKTLNLTSNPIGYEGLYRIIEALKDNTDGWGLKKFKMTDVDIDSIITTDFAENLISNTTLQTLLLGYNGIQCGSGPALELILSKNVALRHLDVQFNEFNSDDGVCIVNGLNNRAKKSLRKLNIQGNMFSEDQIVINQLEQLRNKEIRIRIKM